MDLFMQSTEWRKEGWRDVPYLARQYPNSHDYDIHQTYDAYYRDTLDVPKKGDTKVVPSRCKEDDGTGCAKEEQSYRRGWTPLFVAFYSRSNQVLQDNGIIYERHNKGIPMLHIWDVKRQYGCASEDQAKCSWKLCEVTEEECKLEIDKKTVKISFANNETGKLMVQAVDGYEVKYMLRTDAMRLELEIELELSTPDTKLDCSKIHGEIKLKIEPDCEPYTIAVLNELHPSKKTEGLRPTKITKLDHSDTIKFSVVRIVPRNFRHFMRLEVDSRDSLDVSPRRIFMYNIPVDQHELIPVKNGRIKMKLFWGCRLGQNKGVCTGVCTCEPGEFIGFPKPSGVGCSSTDEPNA